MFSLIYFTRILIYFWIPHFVVVVRFDLLKFDLLFREFFQYPSHCCWIVLWYLCDGTILINDTISIMKNWNLIIYNYLPCDRLCSPNTWRNCRKISHNLLWSPAPLRDIWKNIATNLRFSNSSSQPNLKFLYHG